MGLLFIFVVISSFTHSAMVNQNEVNITQMVNDFTDDLLSWASYKVSDIEMAKDLVQDTFLAAAEKFDSFKGESSPKTWLFSILKFKIIDHYRAKVIRPFNYEKHTVSKFFTDEGEWLPDRKPGNWDVDESSLLDNVDFNEVLKECIEILPEKWSLSVKLKYLMSKKGEEICQELGITPSNYWQIMHRAKLQLRECIESNWFSES